MRPSRPSRLKLESEGARSRILNMYSSEYGEHSENPSPRPGSRAIFLVTPLVILVGIVWTWLILGDSGISEGTAFLMSAGCFPLWLLNAMLISETVARIASRGDSP